MFDAVGLVSWGFTEGLVMFARSIIFLLLMLVSSAAVAEERLALLIGNQAYSGEIGRLANPHNDVVLLEQALKGLGSMSWSCAMPDCRRYSKLSMPTRAVFRHAILVKRADDLDDCAAGSDEERELAAIERAIGAYEAVRWPTGKVVGGKG